MPDAPPDEKIAATVHSRIAQTILDVIAHIPDTNERKSRTPREQARKIASEVARNAAFASGALATPLGFLGMLTLIPELLAVWRIQTKMVADIAAIYGQTPKLTKEQMLYCMFKATAPTAVGALVVIVGESVLVRRTTLRAVQKIAEKVGIKVTQTLLGKSIARWLPLVGALGVGAYTYYETGRVAQTAIDVFEKAIEVEATVSPVTPPGRRTRAIKRPVSKTTARKAAARIVKPAKRKRRTRKPPSAPGA
ncbi:MAG: EcsC family protein [Chthoniobacteraceae bacterium]